MGQMEKKKEDSQARRDEIAEFKVYGMLSEEYENMRVFNALVGDLEQTCKDKLGEEFPWEGTEEQD